MMRPTLGDASAAARVVMQVAPDAQQALARRMVADANRADAWRRERGRFHPEFGDGSLMAAAIRFGPGAEMFLDNSHYINALTAVLCVLDEGCAQPAAQDTQSVAVGSSSSRPSGSGSAQSAHSPNSPASRRSSANSSRWR